jgi:hypothetical protein
MSTKIFVCVSCFFYFLLRQGCGEGVQTGSPRFVCASNTAIGLRFTKFTTIASVTELETVTLQCALD